MERVLSFVAVLALLGVLAFLLHGWYFSVPITRATTYLNQFGTGSEAHEKEYGQRPKAIDELLGKNPRGIVFMTIPSHFSPLDYRVVPSPSGTDAFIIEWIGIDGSFDTGDERRMIHDASGVHIGRP